MKALKFTRAISKEDRRATCEEFSRVTGVPATSVFRILTNDLQKRKFSELWVPHCLTAKQKQKRLDIATLLEERFYVEEQEFLRRIVAIDEEWIRDFESGLKSQSNKFPSVKKYRESQSKAKQIIFAYDHQASHHGR